MQWLVREKDIRSGHYYPSLIRNMALLMIIVSITPLLLISGIAGYQFHTSYHEKVLAHLQELVQKHKQNINRFLQEKRADIQTLAALYSYEQLGDELFLQHILQILQEKHEGVFVDLGLVNDQGFQVAYAGPFKLGKADYSESDWFRKSMKSNFFISDVFLGLRGLPHFIVAVKMQGEGGEWILRSTIDFVAFNSLVENVQIGKTGQAYIVNKNGEYQTRPRSEPALTKDHYLSFLTSGVPQGRLIIFGEGHAETIYPGARAGGREERIAVIEKEDASGKLHVCMMTPLKNEEWILVYQQAATDAFSELYHTRNLAIFILLLGSLAIGLAALVLAKRMVLHIAKVDREKEMMNEQVIEAGKLASVGELAAGIAHEINNPVAIMVEEAGWIEDLLEEEDLKEGENLEEFKRALRQIKTQGSRCKEITHKLLSFARKTDPKVRSLQVNELVDEVMALSEQRARYNNVKVSRHFSENLPQICASPTEMQQVILNLINNAIDAMDKKGGVLEVTTRLDDRYVVIDVGDTGHGIPKANLPRIFDPFFTTKPVGKGTGLGLSICYGIIKKMGGNITVNSAVGVGTIFHIRLPLTEECKHVESDEGPDHELKTGT